MLQWAHDTEKLWKQWPTLGTWRQHHSCGNFIWSNVKERSWTNKGLRKISCENSHLDEHNKRKKKGLNSTSFEKGLSCVGLMAKKRPGVSALHFSFFYCAHWTLGFCTKLCRNVSKVMIFVLLIKWNFRMNGAGATSLKLVLIFTICFLYHVLAEAWRTKFSIR